MTPFLNKIFGQYQNQDASSTCFVFPTRRAAWYFKNLYIEQKKTIWLPEILGIRDFIALTADHSVADETILLILLHQTAVKHGMNVPLEKFIPWGKIILRDFNEIDQNLVDAASLYKHTYEERQIEQQFALSEEEMEELTGFWDLFTKTPLTSLQDHFMESWKILPLIYKDFNQLLAEKKLVYEGNAYKQVAESLMHGKPKLRWGRIVFGGFYALSESEKAILKTLQETGIAEIYWDTDDFYNNPFHEAGHYIRNNELLKKDYNWNGDHFREIPKDIYITGAPLYTAQLKWLSKILKDKLADPGFSAANSVIVLPDEKLLIPLIASLPEELRNINITMGFPAGNSLISGLITAFTTMHLNAINDNGVRKYSSADIESLYTKLYNKGNERIHASPLYVNAEDGNSFFKGMNLFGSGMQLFQAIQTIINFYKNGLSQVHTVENAVAGHLSEELYSLQKLLKPYLTSVSDTVLLHIIDEHIKALKIPFAGEREDAIQVMGFLETRTLDFKNVFILSVNESFLPAVSSGKTYLPYSVRKAYRLPLRNEQDAIYSYHFYRLLQRASEIHLIYNTEAGAIGGGEPSRYLLQIATELNELNAYPVRLHFNQVTTEARMHESIPVNVVKSASVLELMKEKYAHPDAKGLSATALCDYIHCSLKFYLKHIAGLRPEDETPVELDARIFGSVFHTAIKLIYEGYNKATDLQQLDDKIESSLLQAIKEEYGTEVTSGHDFLLKQVLEELLRRVIGNDAKGNLEILGHEMEFTSFIPVEKAGHVKLYGKVDRIDRENDIIRIIDYKTGNDKITDTIDFESMFADPAQKVMLQLMFYTLLYKKNNPHLPVKAGMYKLKALTKGVIMMNKQNILDDLLIDSFEKKAIDSINELFDPGIAFSQTDDVKRCELCDFNKICNRL